MGSTNPCLGQNSGDTILTHDLFAAANRLVLNCAVYHFLWTEIIRNDEIVKRWEEKNF